MAKLDEIKMKPESQEASGLGPAFLMSHAQQIDI
jgi:hypothetical protein